jgi:hypothetical protein
MPFGSALGMRTEAMSLSLLSLVHVATACTGSGEGFDHFGSYVHNHSLHFYKMLFPGFESITSWSQGQLYRCTLAPFELKLSDFNIFYVG